MTAKQLSKRKKQRLISAGVCVLAFLQSVLTGDVEESEQLAAELSRFGVEVKISSKFQQI